jgi:hypothetical protein
VGLMASPIRSIPQAKNRIGGEKSEVRDFETPPERGLTWGGEDI